MRELLIITIKISNILSNEKKLQQKRKYIETKKFYRLRRFNIKFWKINYFSEIIVRARSASEIIKNILWKTKKPKSIFRQNSAFFSIFWIFLIFRASQLSNFLDNKKTVYINNKNKKVLFRFPNFFIQFNIININSVSFDQKKTRSY